MSKKIKIMIMVLLSIVFFVTVYATCKIIPKNRSDKPAESISINEDDKESGFDIRISSSASYKSSYFEDITIYIYYKGKMINCINTYVDNDGKALSEDFFKIEYHDDYVKVIILDSNKKITGVFRGYFE